MTESNDVPSLIKIAIGHYFFGYIHPFYDGNGRTSRFISSMFLADSLGKISAISLSRGCNEYMSKYLKGFEITNSIMGRGEMNCFIDSFLDIISDALHAMLLEIKEKDELLRIAAEKLKNDPNLDGKQYGFMFVLAQNHFFHFSDGVTVNELSNVLKLSRATVRKIAKELADHSLIEQRGIRPAHFVLKSEYFEK